MLTSTSSGQIILFPALTNVDVGAYKRVEVVYQMRTTDHDTGGSWTIPTVVAEMPPVANPLNPSPGDWGNGTTRGNVTLSGTTGNTTVVRFGNVYGAGGGGHVVDVFCKPLRLTAWATFTGSVGTPSKVDFAGRIQVWGYADNAPILAPALSGLNPAQSPGVARTQAIAFDVAAVGKVLVWVHFPEMEDAEVAWNGDAFLPKYAASSVSNITGGLHFNLVRRGGWPSSPAVVVEGTVD